MEFPSIFLSNICAFSSTKKISTCNLHILNLIFALFIYILQIILLLRQFRLLSQSFAPDLFQHSKQLVLTHRAQGPDGRSDEVMRPVAGAGGREAEVAQDGGRVGVGARHSEAVMSDLAHVTRHVIRSSTGHTHP